MQGGSIVTINVLNNSLTLKRKGYLVYAGGPPKYLPRMQNLHSKAICETLKHLRQRETEAGNGEHF